LEANIEVGLEVNVEEMKTKVKYLETTVTKNYIHKEIKSRLNAGNA